ncbi:MAG: twin-arginine translocase TatA/TatE family subunit [Syntrophomonas sp.]
MGSIGPWELVIILTIALFVFGPSKLPDIAKGLGKAVNEFKNASTGIQKQFQEALLEEAPPVVRAASPANNLLESLPDKKANSGLADEHLSDIR